MGRGNESLIAKSGSHAKHCNNTQKSSQIFSITGSPIFTKLGMKDLGFQLIIV